MGTNYYLDGFPSVDYPGREALHIGKSSFGWVFTFRAYPTQFESPVVTTDDWRRMINGMVVNGPHGIVDEYGDDVDPEEFFAKVAAKSVTGMRQSQEYGGDFWHVDTEGNEFVYREFC